MKTLLIFSGCMSNRNPKVVGSRLSEVENEVANVLVKFE